MTNRLAGETSPYLRQHAENPVDWQPWGDHAFNEAAERDVPILLSVGYSACHWCHVMAHESFEDADVAAVMNQWFVPVKVDREERPDIDAIYMEATQAMTGQGGWPMTVFMDPAGRPFYCGTYFPPLRRGGHPGFVELMEAVNDAWTQRRHELTSQADRLTEALNRTLPVPEGSVSADEHALTTILDDATTKLLTQYDAQWGGFGTAPKFPQTFSLGHLLRDHHRTGNKQSLDAVINSLDAMAAGGMIDHIGGGFSRYSVDQQWLIPHFEKMLYDNALLTRLYVDAFLVTGDSRLADAVSSTLEYVLADLSHANGGRFSAEDADSLATPEDSHAVEGAFYTFTADEVTDILNDAGLEALASEACEFWGIDGPPNFEGRWIPNRLGHRGAAHGSERLGPARQALHAARALRPRPGLDDKILTEWNALWISAAAAAGAALGRTRWIEEAETTADFLLGNLRNSQGRWLRAWQAEGGAQHLGYSSDYAALVEAFLELYMATGKLRWLHSAQDCADALLELFWDPEGGMFTTGTDAPDLLIRPSEDQDNATAAATSTAAVAFLKLSALSDEDTYRQRASEIVDRFAALAAQAPMGFGRLLEAVSIISEGVTEVVVTGSGEVSEALVQTVQQGFTPNLVLAFNERAETPLWAGRGDESLAYVCRNYVCDSPTAEPSELKQKISPVPGSR